MLERLLMFIRDWMTSLGFKSEIITREDAARQIVEREITVKYNPLIIEFDHKALSQIAPQSIIPPPLPLHSIQGSIPPSPDPSFLLATNRQTTKPKRNWSRRRK